MSTSPGMPPAPPPPQSSSKKGCIIVVIVVLLLLLVGCVGACVYFMRNAGNLMGMAAEQMRPQVEAALDPAAPATLREEFMEEYDAQVTLMKETMQLGNPDAANKVMAPFNHLNQAMGDQKLTEEEMTRYVELARAARGQ